MRPSAATSPPLAKPSPKTPPPDEEEQSLGWWDLALGAILAVALACVIWTGSAYAPPLAKHFPKQPTEYRPAEALESARREALAALDKDPDDLTAYTQLAMSEFERGAEHYIVKEAPLDKPDGMGALQLAEKALEMGALDERLFFYAGVMYEELHYFDYAIPKYEAYLRHHPEDLETRLRLGNLYYRQDYLDKSIDAFKKVLAQKPGDPLVAYNLAFALRDAKRWPEALEALAPFTNQGRTLPTGGHRLLGDVHRGLGDTPRALEEYKAELAASGEGIELAVSMASIYEELGDQDAAAERWEKVLQFDAGHREARNRLRRLNRPVPVRPRR